MRDKQASDSKICHIFHYCLTLQESATVALSAFLSEYYRQADGHPKSQEQGRHDTRD